MKITGGVDKGRTIRIKRSYLSDNLRPTSQKVRKALFDILQDRIIGALFLDLFSGTGAIGLEAMSRGAKRVVFVEHKRHLINSLKFNLQLIDQRNNIEIYHGDVTVYLRHTEDQFDIVFADPPYEYDGYEGLVGLVSQRNLLSKNGLLVIEHSSKVNIKDVTETLCLKKAYRYGDTTLSLFRQRVSEGLAEI